jgi:hypothetical protein
MYNIAGLLMQISTNGRYLGVIGAAVIGGDTPRVSQRESDRRLAMSTGGQF